jgi:AraC-like DNA-binding protein
LAGWRGSSEDQEKSGQASFMTEEGTLYQTILDEERHRLALQYLQNSKVTIKEIAFNLGYTDPANFWRVFKR